MPPDAVGYVSIPKRPSGCAESSDVRTIDRAPSAAISSRHVIASRCPLLSQARGATWEVDRHDGAAVLDAQCGATDLPRAIVEVGEELCAREPGGRLLWRQVLAHDARRAVRHGAVGSDGDDAGAFELSQTCATGANSSAAAHVSPPLRTTQDGRAALGRHAARQAARHANRLTPQARDATMPASLATGITSLA
jgi:hypothetical protein